MTQIIKLDFSKYNGNAPTPIGWYSVTQINNSHSVHHKEWMVCLEENVLCFTKTRREGREYCVFHFTETVKACLIL